uniref:Putative metalloprotease n=1 Tax=Ixodes ricinus TaxID=34613 RepID=A0A0K8RJ12_IXORI
MCDGTEMNAIFFVYFIEIYPSVFIGFLQMNGKVLEQHLYHDKKNTAAVQVTEKNGTVEVRGIVGERLRIIPLPLVARSGNGAIAHKLFQIESSAHYGDDYIVSFRSHFLKHELPLQRLNRLKTAGKFQILSWLNCRLSPTCTISNISIPLKRRYCI